MILFDLTAAPDPDDHPVARFRAIHFEGGPAPEFLPPWEETDRLEISLRWEPTPAPSFAAQAASRVVHCGPRRALGAIDGFFHRHAERPDGRQKRRRLTAKIAHSSPGNWRLVCELYRLFGKSNPWRLKRYGVPPWALEEVRL